MEEGTGELVDVGACDVFYGHWQKQIACFEERYGWMEERKIEAMKRKKLSSNH